MTSLRFGTVGIREVFGKDIRVEDIFPSVMLFMIILGQTCMVWFSTLGERLVRRIVS